MQLILDINNDSLANKIIKILDAFKDDGVKIQKPKTKNQKPKTKIDDQYIKEHWRELGMNTHSADLDDDERLYDAAARFYNECAKQSQTNQAGQSSPEKGLATTLEPNYTG